MQVNKHVDILYELEMRHSEVQWLCDYLRNPIHAEEDMHDAAMRREFFDNLTKLLKGEPE